MKFILYFSRINLAHAATRAAKTRTKTIGANRRTLSERMRDVIYAEKGVKLWFPRGAKYSVFFSPCLIIFINILPPERNYRNLKRCAVTLICAV